MALLTLRATDGADSFAFAAGDGAARILGFEVGVDSLSASPYAAIVREVVRADGVPVTIYRYGWGNDVVRLPGVSGVTVEQLEHPGGGAAAPAPAVGNGVADAHHFDAWQGAATIEGFEVGLDSLSATTAYGYVPWVLETTRDGVAGTEYRYGWADDVVWLPGVTGVTVEQLEHPGAAAPAPADPGMPDNNGQFREAFFDGFDGNAVDRSKWGIVYGGSTYWNGAFRWDANEVSVSDGVLNIGLSKQADGLWNVGGLSTAPYPGAPDGIGYEFTYGRVEIRAKASQEVTGAGPCFLLWPADLDRWPPEVDILETPKGQGMFTNHWQGPGGNGDDQYEAHLFDIDYSQWHTYTLDWTPDRLALYVDGQLIREMTENIPHEPMTVGLQGHVGAAHDDWYGGSPNGSGVDRVDILVDYVRVSEWIGG